MNMKTRLFGMMAILVSIFAMTACQKDKADDTYIDRSRARLQ